MQTDAVITKLETIARQKLAASLSTNIDATQLDLKENMSDIYGLTSLNKILFITSLCNEMNIDLSNFTEDDLGNMKTLGNVINILNNHIN
ncbi:acyl carrier protein [Xenorhabdus sp. XENO-10]|uniref:Acyl carrier protein n=1 Tax=Xenorhabdus yunnanensis TaxID=3025878 RepID=A0ABT5LIF8_9GAMM|nr:acyl carrier protein [Xenorhabdus yunnanensis]MDC9589575.1 acyl carrier protein [Xenorhabdus yunnanensis]